MTRFEFSKSSSFRKAEDSPGFLLWRVSILWRRSVEDVLKPLGLTHPQFVILATIGWFTKEGNQANQIEISRHAGLDPNTTSQILRSLQKKQLIERVHEQDERSKHSRLTKKGAQTLEKALPAVEEADSHFFSSVSLTSTSAIEALQVLAGFKPSSS